jgi:hypothetical protein
MTHQPRTHGVCAQEVGEPMVAMPLTKKDVVVLALSDLGATTAVADTEEVAIAAHARAPKAFGWRKHVEQIDLEAVRTSLRHEKETAQPRLDGSIRHGWHLTPAGQAWLSDHPDTASGAPVRVADTPARTAARRAETHEVAATVDRLRSSSAFRAWSSGEPLVDRDAAAVFRIDGYTPVRDRVLKTAKVRELVVDHPDLLEFLEAAIPVALALGTQAGTLTAKDPPS